MIIGRAFVDDKVNAAIPPWLNMFVCPKHVLVATPAGRVSRLNQMKLSYKVYREALQVEIVRWLIAGYPVHVLRSLWSHVRVPGSNVARTQLKAIHDRMSMHV